MIYFDVPRFQKTHREQLQAMCAVPPALDGKRDEFAYFPVDAVYTTGSGLPSFLVKAANQNNQLLSISEDSDVIFTHWNLALLLHEFIGKHEQKWLNKLTQSSLPTLQHSFASDTALYPVTGLNSLYLTLLAYKRNISDNVWRLSRDSDDNTAYLSSYIHQVKVEPSSETLKHCPHPFVFLDPDSLYQQHVYAGVNITPFSKNQRNFCERLPFSSLGMQYTPSSWVFVLINKFSYFEPFKVAAEIAGAHPDLFSALVVCSVGLPANMLYDHANYCSLLGVSKYQICEMLVLMSPLVDYCTAIMTDDRRINHGVSYYLEQSNYDIA